MSKKILMFAAIMTAISFFVFNMKVTDETFGRFQTFKLQQNKHYQSIQEQTYRKAIFMKNLAKIQLHNSDKTQTYYLGITQFADLTQEQFVNIYLKTIPHVIDNSHSRTQRPSNLRDIDWDSLGKVTQVKNQGQCGSCWAFSAVAALQSGILIKNGSSTDLSQQQLVDCSRSYGNQGCNGGWMDSAFEYIRDHGIANTADYPYVARDQACKIDGGAVKVSGYIDVPGCTALTNALNSRPISVAVDASNWSLYRGGVLTSCGQNINHGVLAIGYTSQYWRIKNSWGTGWGESGFIRIAYGNTCNVCSYPSYPTL